MHCYLNTIADSIMCSSLKIFLLKLEIFLLISRKFLNKNEIVINSFITIHEVSGTKVSLSVLDVVLLKMAVLTLCIF